jgi:hypothetical protein
MHRAVKAAPDPHGILDPGKIFWSKMVRRPVVATGHQPPD